MKNTTETKELLIKFCDYLHKSAGIEALKTDAITKAYVGDFINNLALGKPELLEKNKQPENSFKCDACPETFKTLPDLVEHVKDCDVERYI